MSREWLCPHCKRLPGSHASWCEIGMKEQPRPTISAARINEIAASFAGGHLRFADYSIPAIEKAINQALREAGVTVEGKS